METQEFYANINYLAVLVSALVYFGIGAIWYSKALFGTAWLQMMPHIDMTKNEGMAKLMISTFILTLICVFITATIVSAAGATSVGDGINLGVRLAIGFMAATMAINYMYESRPAKLFWINAGYHFVGIVISAVILSVWK